MAHSPRLYIKFKPNPFIWIFLFINSLLSNLAAQQFNNWCFPSLAGISFNTPQPTSFTTAAVGRSSASISDFNGNLLFYSDGQSVFNRLHQAMPTGSGLNGGGLNQSSGTIILPFSTMNNKYYVFNSQGLGFGTTIELGYTYNIVDMSLDNGFGDVITKNVRLGTFNSSEKIAAVPHINGSDIWVICRDRYNNYYSYRVGCQGVDTVPSITSIGYNLLNQNLVYGVMKASPNGKILGVANPTTFELFHINQSDGTLNDRIELKISYPFGVEFSPDSKFLYVTSDTFQNAQKARVFQFDLSSYDSTSIQNSQATLISLDFNSLGQFNHLQLAPDGRIYKGVFAQPWLDVINQPLLAGAACGFTRKVISLGNNQSLGSLPFAPPFIYQNPNAQLYHTVSPDCRTVTFTGKSYIQGQTLTFRWDFGDGTTQLQTLPSGGDTTFSTIIHTYAASPDSFNVLLRVSSDTVCGEGTAGKGIGLRKPRPRAHFSYTTACNSLNASFADSSTASAGAARTWTFFNKAGAVLGSSSQLNASFTFPFFDTVRVRLIVTDTEACMAADTAEKLILLSPKPLTSFVFRQSCSSYNITFNASSNRQPVSYNWLWGDGTQSQSVTSDSVVHLYTDTGTYNVQLTAVTAEGCPSEAIIISVQVQPFLTPAFTYNPACAGETVAFTNTTVNRGAYTYSWLVNGIVQSSAQNFNQTFSAGRYAIKLEATNTTNGCAASVEKNIAVEDLHLSLTASGNPAFEDDEVTLLTTAGINYTVLLWRPFSLFSVQTLKRQRLIADSSQLIEVVGQSSGGCRDTASLLLEVKPLDGVYVPSAFTPDGDGKNDILRVAGGGIASIDFTIFNRWGQVVFYSKDKSAGWDGYLKGKKQTTGTYVYILRVKKLSGQVVEKKGTVMLIH